MHTWPLPGLMPESGAGVSIKIVLAPLPAVTLSTQYVADEHELRYSRHVSCRCAKGGHLSLLNWPTEEKLPSRRSQLRRRSVALTLLNKFGQSFLRSPTICYGIHQRSMHRRGACKRGRIS
jgi:hypothetical protein